MVPDSNISSVFVIPKSLYAPVHRLAEVKPTSMNTYVGKLEQEEVEIQENDLRSNRVSIRRFSVSIQTHYFLQSIHSMQFEIQVYMLRC